MYTSDLGKVPNILIIFQKILNFRKFSELPGLYRVQIISQKKIENICKNLGSFWGFEKLPLKYNLKLKKILFYKQKQKWIHPEI